MTAKAPITSYFPISDAVNHRVLAANTAETEDIPVGKVAVMILTDADLFIRRDALAAVPAADVADGTGSVYIPAGSGRSFSLGNTSYISVISASIAKVTFEYFD